MKAAVPLTRVQPAAGERGTAPARFAAGVALVLSSAIAFGAMPTLATVAYAYGATPFTLLTARFAVAWAALAAAPRLARARSLPAGARPSFGEHLTGFLLGAVLYAGTALGFFASLRFVPAGVAALLFYTYPALVATGSAWIGRRAPTAAQGVAVAAAVGGSALVAGANLGGLDGRGVLLALAAAASYTGYILLSHPLQERLGAGHLARLVSAGACLSSFAAALAAGDRFAAIRAPGWAAAAALGLVSTAYAVTAFLAGMAKVGPTVASVLSAAEPLTALLLATAVLGEHLARAQAVGAILVVAAVVLASVPVCPARMGGWKRPHAARAGHNALEV